jgi:hypothetical protein
MPPACSTRGKRQNFATGPRLWLAFLKLPNKCPARGAELGKRRVDKPLSTPCADAAPSPVVSPRGEP